MTAKGKKAETKTACSSGSRLSTRCPRAKSLSPVMRNRCELSKLHRIVLVVDPVLVDVPIVDPSIVFTTYRRNRVCWILFDTWHTASEGCMDSTYDLSQSIKDMPREGFKISDGSEDVTIARQTQYRLVVAVSLRLQCSKVETRLFSKEEVLQCPGEVAWILG